MQAGEQGGIAGQSGERIGIQDDWAGCGQREGQECRRAVHPHARPEAQGGDALVLQRLGQGCRIADGLEHDRIQLRRVFDQGVRRATQRDQPCPDPERAAGGKAGRPTLARGAGEDEGVAVGEFVVRIFSKLAGKWFNQPD